MAYEKALIGPLPNSYQREPPACAGRQRSSAASAQHRPCSTQTLLPVSAAQSPVHVSARLLGTPTADRRAATHPHQRRTCTMAKACRAKLLCPRLPCQHRMLPTVYNPIRVKHTNPARPHALIVIRACVRDMGRSPNSHTCSYHAHKCTYAQTYEHHCYLYAHCV